MEGKVSLITNMSFIIESKGQMNLFKNFTSIRSPSRINTNMRIVARLQPCKMSCKERVLLAGLVAGIRPNDLCTTCAS